MTNKKICVLGAGSIGCYLGGQLANAGLDVTFIGRIRFQKQLEEHGLTLTHFAKPKLHVPKPVFETKPSAMERADIVLLCVKSQDTEMAAQQIKTHAPNAQIISFQNGIRNVETLQKIFPATQIIPAIVPFNVTPTEPGCFHCGTDGALIVGPGIDESLMEGFHASGQAIKIDPEIEAAQWTKMIINLNNALNALTGGTLMQGLIQKDYRRALGLCIDEAIGIARANGIEPGAFNGRKPEQLLKTLRLPNVLYKFVMQKIVKIDAKARSSMLDDLEVGRVSEIDYLQGEIVRRAEKTGLTAPYNQKILEMTLEAFEKGRSPKLTGAEIFKFLTD